MISRLFENEFFSVIDHRHTYLCSYTFLFRSYVIMLVRLPVATRAGVTPRKKSAPFCIYVSLIEHGIRRNGRFTISADFYTSIMAIIVFSTFGEDV